LSVFSTPANIRVVKIAHFQFLGGLVNNRHIVIDCNTLIFTRK
jgi:hypothetical protein